MIVHPTRRMVAQHHRAAARIETQMVVNGPIAMDPPGVVVTVEEIYGG